MNGAIGLRYRESAAIYERLILACKAHPIDFISGYNWNCNPRMGLKPRKDNQRFFFCVSGAQLRWRLIGGVGKIENRQRDEITPFDLNFTITLILIKLGYPEYIL